MSNRIIPNPPESSTETAHRLSLSGFQSDVVLLVDIENGGPGWLIDAVEFLETLPDHIQQKLTVKIYQRRSARYDATSFPGFDKFEFRNGHTDRLGAAGSLLEIDLVSKLLRANPDGIFLMLSSIVALW
ncbi:hypothetical protein HDU87_006362 [Geranomyces variabilis]|uniref:Uncharacterized protein n=1 Tax=Geranomyces variabilis TaxID=109894 RepID=A0AAD5TFN5_9FUNG|nr:hypothetical protein HDU87_006362 [Geranomyces variabilis]